MSTIPEDIKQKIRDESEKRFPILHVTENAAKNSRKNQARFAEGASFGYSLAIERVGELESEKAELIELIDTLIADLKNQP